MRIFINALIFNPKNRPRLPRPFTSSNQLLFLPFPSLSTEKLLLH